MATKVAELWVEIGARLDKFNAGMEQVEKRMLKVGQKMTAIGKSMTRNVTLPLLAIGTAAVKMGADFDKAMTESLAIMGDVSDSMRIKMAEAAKEMSTKTTFAANKLAEAYFFLASAGMDAAQSIKALPVVAKFAQAGAFDLATATDLLTDAQTALGLSSKNAIENQKNLIKVADVLVKANTLANASVLQFSESLTNRAAASLVNVNKSMEEGVAVLAAFADKGVKGQVAGMRLAMMLDALDITARKNKKAWEDIGLTLFDAQGEMKSIGDIIGDLEGALKGLTTEQRGATLAQLGFNIRTKASILTLLGSSEKIKQWTKDLKDAGGTMEIVAKKQLQAFTNQMKILRNNLVNVGIQIGDILIPVIKDLIDDHIRPAIERFSKLSEGTKKMILIVAGLVAGLGPLLLIFGKVLTILPMLRTALATTTGHIGLMIAAAVALGAVLNTLIDNYSKKQDAELAAMIKNATPLVQAHALRKKLIEDEILTIEQWSKIFNKHGRSYKRVMRVISTLPEYAHIKAKWEEMQEAQKKTGASAKDLADKFKTDLANALGIVTDKAKTWIDYLRSMGLKTIKDKQERIAELTGYLKDLHQAYKDGKIDLEAYINAQRTAKNEMKALATTMVETSLPAARDMTGILEQVPIALEGIAFVYEKVIKKMSDAQVRWTKRALGEFMVMEAGIRGFVGAILGTFESWAIGQIIPKIMAALPFPVNLLAVGGAIATIKAVFAKLQSFEEGGFVPQETIARLHPGERVLSAAEVRRGAGEGGGVTIHVSPMINITAIDALGVRDFMRNMGIKEIVEAIKAGVMKPEFREALGVKS